MRQDNIELEVKAAVAPPAGAGDGVAKDVRNLTHKTIHVASNNWNGTIQFQASQNGTHWSNVGSPVSNAGTPGWAANVYVDETVKYIRAQTTAYTAGTAWAEVAGYNVRTE